MGNYHCTCGSGSNKEIHRLQSELTAAKADNQCWEMAVAELNRTISKQQAENERLREACENTVSVLCGHENSGTDPMTIQAKAVMRDAKTERLRLRLRVCELGEIARRYLATGPVAESAQECQLRDELKRAIHLPRTDAWPLRVQAETLEAFELKLNATPGAMLWDMDQVQSLLNSEAQRLRQQASELEHPDGRS